MLIRVLGPIEIGHGQLAIGPSSRHQRTLIAVLACELGQPVSVDRLIDLIWADPPPATARTKLHGHVSELRKALSRTWPDIAHHQWPLVTRNPGYLLSADRVTVDLLEYRALTRRASAELEAGQMQAASQNIGEALAMWHGPAFTDVDAPALTSMAEALQLGRLLEIERKAACDLQLGRTAAVAEELAGLLALHPLREGARAALMLALYTLGCRAESLQLYRSGRLLLRDELGIDPGPLLQRIHKLILADDAPRATRGLLAHLTGVTPDIPRSNSGIEDLD